MPNIYTIRKDSAKSLEQMIWQHRVAEYARLKQSLATYAENSMSSYRAYCIKRIAELEQQYPLLLK